MHMWSVYSLSDGLLTGRVIQCQNQAQLQDNIPDGCAVVEGRLSPKTHRVDLQTGQAVAWQPDRPADTEFATWQWDDAAGWQPVPTLAAVARDVREERDRRLAACDWVTLRAADLGEEVPQPWQAYRQALRDVSDQPGFPSEVVWPDPPAE